LAHQHFHVSDTKDQQWMHSYEKKSHSQVPSKVQEHKLGFMGKEKTKCQQIPNLRKQISNFTWSKSRAEKLSQVPFPTKTSSVGYCPEVK